MRAHKSTDQTVLSLDFGRPKKSFEKYARSILGAALRCPLLHPQKASVGRVRPNRRTSREREQQKPSATKIQTLKPINAMCYLRFDKTQIGRAHV